METLRLYWMGSPRVEFRGGPIKLETRKSMAMLAYLSTVPERSPRELLATLFWPEADQQRALGNLRRTLSSLGSRIPGWIQADRQSIALGHSEKLWVDLDAFRRLVSQSRKHGHSRGGLCAECSKVLKQATSYYRGDFLDGLNLGDCPKFDDWQLFQRQGLRCDMAEALQRLSSWEAESGNWGEAIDIARRWQALDHLDEAACRALMDLYMRSGERSAALHTYEELAIRLKEAQDQEPESITRQLYEQISGPRRSAQLGAGAPSAPTFPLLKTKLFIPTAAASRVARSRLIDALEQVEHRTLTLISAPAGFGKTTLLAEWIAHTSLPVAWLSLDSADNNPHRLLSYLVAALEAIHEGAGTEARAMLQSPQMVAPHTILASLINDLAKAAEPYVLILDDYQFVTDGAVHGIVSYLLDHRPSTMHLVISSRTDPPLQLGRLRAHGQLLELRTQDLRFTEVESAEFLNTSMALGLSDGEIRALEEKTEGWIAGLQMAAISLRHSDRRAEFIVSFSGSNRYILDYLMEEVLSTQLPHIGGFLIATSILDRLNGALCDAVFGREFLEPEHANGQEMLEYLERSNVFVVPLDNERRWFRYHHLFADLLRSRIQKYSRDQISLFRQRASVWCQAQGLMLDAIKYAIDAADYSRAAELLDEIGRRYFPPTEFGALQTCIDRIPVDIVRQHPWTCLAQTHIWVAIGFVDRVEQWLDWAEACALQERQDASDQDRNALLGAITLDRAYARFLKGEPIAAAALARAGLRQLEPSQAALRCRLTLFVGETCLVQGRFEQSDRFLREAIHLSREIPDMFLFTTACYRLSLQLKIQGRLTEAEKLYVENMERLQQAGMSSSFLMIKPLIGLGDVYRERGQLDAAEDLLREGLEKSEHLGLYEVVYSYNLMAKLRQARGDNQQALEYLNKAADMFDAFAIPEAIRQVTNNLRGALWLAEGRTDLVEKWRSLAQPAVAPGIDFLNELDFTTKARVLIAAGQYSEAAELLEQLAQLARRQNRTERLIKALILQAIALEGSGRGDKALSVLTEGLSLAEPEEYARTFLDEGKPLVRLLQQLQSSELSPHLRQYVSRLLEHSAS